MKREYTSLCWSCRYWIDKECAKGWGRGVKDFMGFTEECDDWKQVVFH